MRRAFSLIELLFAIVIVGVAVSALPFITASTTKANTQAVVSEIVTSSRIFLDDILSEPWNSAIANGFTDSSGAVMYSGILQAQADDKRFDSDAKIYFHRTLARDKDGTPIQTAGIISCNTGINCQNGASTSLKSVADDFKNAFEFDITAEVRFIDIKEDTVGKKITATFSDTAATDTSNAMMVSATATGKDGAAIVDDVKQIRLNGFAFNIGTEPR